jgi:hypothetical protein
MFATGSRTSPAATVDQTWTASTDRAAASKTPRGTNTPSIILSPDHESEHRGKAGAPARTETAALLRAGGDPGALSPPRVRPLVGHQCAPVLAGVKVVRPIGRATLTPAPGRQPHDHEGAALSVPTKTPQRVPPQVRSSNSSPGSCRKKIPPGARGPQGLADRTGRQMPCWRRIRSSSSGRSGSITRISPGRMPGNRAASRLTPSRTLRCRRVAERGSRRRAADLRPLHDLGGPCTKHVRRMQQHVLALARFERLRAFGAVMGGQIHILAGEAGSRCNSRNGSHTLERQEHWREVRREVRYGATSAPEPRRRRSAHLVVRCVVVLRRRETPERYPCRPSA